MLPHLNPQLLFYPQHKHFFLRKKILKFFAFPLAPSGHQALHRCPSLPMRSKYMFVRYSLQVRDFGKFSTTTFQIQKKLTKIYGPYLETLMYAKLLFNKQCFSLVRIEKTT
jgi:hypothetical protein